MDSPEPTAVSHPHLPAPVRVGGDSPTLRDLSALAAQGDHDAFEQLHRRVGAGLRRLLLKRSAGREDLVDDLCQKTWTSVWKALSEGKYDPARAAITTFVYAVGNNAWFTHLRSFARDQGYVNGSPAMLGESHLDSAPHRHIPVADAHGQAETIDAVRACLRDGGPGALTDNERAIVRAIAAGESDRALARRLVLSSSTVNIRKHAGYSKIRAYLRSKGLVADDWADDESPESQPNPAREHRSPLANDRDGDGGVSGGGGGGINRRVQPVLSPDPAGRLP